MLVSRSPPPPQPFSLYVSNPRPRHRPRPAIPATIAPTPTSAASTPAGATMPVAAPRRPCLVVRPEEAMEEVGSDPPSPTRLKKRVVFADAKGLSLTQVRVMREPSAAPPAWSAAFLEHLRRGLGVGGVWGELGATAAEAWAPAFAQPAADYVRFRRRVDALCVSLENVIVRDAEGVAVGTAKVRNLCFGKEVVVRCSCDAWASQQDTLCSYVKSPSPMLVPSQSPSPAPPPPVPAPLYDTFSFRLPLPPHARRLEFCVRFRCEDGREFWDNNEGHNYVLLRRTTTPTGPSAPEGNGPAPTQDSSLKAAGKCGDALYAKMDAWSEFASWNHLVNDGPYW